MKKNKKIADLEHSFLGDKVWFELRPLVNMVEKQLSNLALSRGKLIGTTMSEQMPHYYLGNPLCIIDALNNLASYPLFHLDETCVLLYFHADSLGSGKYHLCVTATTTGAGIPASEFNHIFDPISKKGGQRNSSLYIAKTLASFMGGDLTIENTFGWGTRYILQLVVESDLSVVSSDDEIFPPHIFPEIN